ncbi:MAG: ATP-dependent zinc protease [Guyparkeria sp.]|uniref:ATP-dependent zinc protease family protein n=1 Tax=Guyparkeria sp. TaxID=2035736 RepID=UPI00397C96A2
MRATNATRQPLLAALLVVPGLLLASAPGLAGGDESEGDTSLPVFGYVEDIAVRALDGELRAKMDSGATTTSIDAREIEEFEKDDEEWVRFEVAHRDSDEMVTLERPVSRTVRIKRHDRSPQKRYVVELALCLGDKWITDEVSLTNREQFSYGLLVGRNHMAGQLLIDPSAKDLQTSRCD